LLSKIVYIFFYVDHAFLISRLIGLVVVVVVVVATAAVAVAVVAAVTVVCVNIKLHIIFQGRHHFEAYLYGTSKRFY
jgi:hypothetical protein